MTFAKGTNKWRENSERVFLIGIVLGLLLLFSPDSMGTTWIDIPASDDAYIGEHMHGTSGGSPDLFVGIKPPIPFWYRTYLKFNLSSALPEGSHIGGAEIYLCVQDSGIPGSGVTDVDIHHVLNHNWNEDTLSYLNAPGFKGIATDSVQGTFSPPGYYYYWIVSSDVLEDYAVGDQTSFAVKVQGEPHSTWINFHSKESPQSNVAPYLHVWYDPPYIVPDDYSTIQAAIDASKKGGHVIVKPGTYYENIDFKGMPITIRSEQGPEVTVINGTQTDSVVVFKNNEDQYSMLDGFTITNGKANNGGGIYCANASPILKNNIVINNQATANYGGGGIYCSNANPFIYDNSITENTATVAGGGLRLEYCSPLITHNTISNNHAFDGGGISTDHFNGAVENNVISGNNATRSAGGFACSYSSSPTVINNTITGNSAKNGGGMYFSYSSNANVSNTIIWDNTATASGPQIKIYSANPTFTYCDIQGGWSGFGNIDEDPMFSDPVNGDYHLTLTSPCINRGTDTNAPGDDMDKEGRPCMGTVDIGADEFIDTHILATDSFSVSAATGGTVNFMLDCGLDNAGRSYVVLGSVSGTAPGTPLPQNLAILRLNWDIFTDLVLSMVNTPLFINFRSSLDTQGRSTAQLNTPILSSTYVGLKMQYAFSLLNKFDFVSNPVEIEILN